MASFGRTLWLENGAYALLLWTAAFDIDRTQGLWDGLAVCSRNVAVHIQNDHIVWQTLTFLFRKCYLPRRLTKPVASLARLATVFATSVKSCKNCDRFKTPAQVLQNWRLCFWLWFDLMKHRDTSVTHVLVLHNSRLCLWLQLDPGKKNRSPIYQKLHLFSCTGVCDSGRAKPLPAILKRRKRRYSLKNLSKR